MRKENGLRAPESALYLVLRNALLDALDLPWRNCTSPRQVALELVQLGWPLSTAFVLQSGLQIVSLSYAGGIGDVQLAVVGMGQQLVLVGGLGIFFMASSEALSTLAT